jgi:chloride channel protein, CIC family
MAPSIHERPHVASSESGDAESAVVREYPQMAEAGAGPAATPDPAELLRSRSYLVLLVFGAIIGVPIAAVAYFFLKATSELQHFFFATLPGDLGFGHEPLWWPLPLLVIGGLLVGLTIRYLPGTAGHKPAEGLKTGTIRPIELPGIVIAALVTLACGAVLGPEAPLIAIGSGLGALAVALVKRDAPPTAVLVIGVAGSFAAVSTLLGSPIVGAFLLMEAAGIGGPLLGVVLVPGLLAAGVGALIFVGLDNWTGFGTFSLAIPQIPQFATPDGGEFLWAIGIGVAAALLGSLIKRAALSVQPIVERRILLLTPAAGVVIAGAAILFAATTDRGSSEVLFSGQSALPSLIQNAAGWTAASLALLVLVKGVAYCASLSAFRGGPIFPGMFIGAAGGMALSHLPGLPMIAGAAMGIGAMTVAMLGLPLTSVLLTTLFLQVDGLALMPLVIVAVVVSYVVSARLAPAPASQPPADAPAADDAAAVPGSRPPAVETGSASPAAGG